ncbi:MAG: efflux RND transporter permease subunit [Rhodomicrobiaceae bacterium]
MSLPEICIRRPVMTTLLMLSFIAAGLFGFRQLPIAALPRVDFPTIQVTATLPGAGPESMAASVATPLERQFSTISGVSSMTSVNSLGLTQITLQFDLDRDIDSAALDVQSALTTAARRLPPEMTTPPSFRKVNPADAPILFISLTSKSLPLYTVNEYGDTVIAQRISSLPGVAQVNIFGSQKFAVRVKADLKALAGANLTLTDLQNAIAGANTNKPLGSLSGDKQSLTLQASGQLAKATDYGSLPVTYRNGLPVRLRDVATVKDGVENDQIASWFNGTRSILLAIYRQPDANTVSVVDSVKAILPSLTAQVPPSIDTHVVLDRSLPIRSAVSDVEITLGLAITLVILVIFLFLRSVTATVIPAIALPISLVGTFGGMYLLGYSIDNLSLLALTLSVGFIVDDAIVMLENIVRHVEGGEQPFEAALRGSREIAFTIVSMTVSLVAVFIPVLFMGGIVGRLFKEFAVTISMTILISGIVSLTLTPMLASRMLRPQVEHGQRSRLYRWSEAAFNALLAGYDRSLRFALRIRPIMLLITFATLIASGYYYVVIPKGFFPEEDTGSLLATTEAGQDVSFDAMVAIQQQLAKIVQSDPAVAVVNSTVGAGGPNNSANSGRMFIGLKPLDERKVSATEVIQRLRRKLSGIPAANTFIQSVQNIRVGGRLSKSQYQYTLQSSDIGALQDFVPKFADKLSQDPGFRDVTTDLLIRSPQAFVDIDRERAAALGVSADAIRDTLYSAFGDRQVATIYTQTDDFEVILEAAENYQQNIADLSQIYVRSVSGALVPLTSVADVKRTAGPITINHSQLIPSVTVSFNLAPGVSLGDAVDRINQLEASMSVPASITGAFQGTAQVFQDSLKGQGILILAAVFVIYVVLGVLYESFIHPVTILSGLPSAGLGALLTLQYFGLDLNVIAIIGIVMLIGIVKKNAIMMIDVALHKQRAGETSPEKAIYEACLLRFRPIMMTTLAAILGAIPIAVGLGSGSELRRPLGLVVAGGLILSQLLTLYITPVVFIYLEKTKRYFFPGKVAPRRPEARIEAPAE